MTVLHRFENVVHELGHATAVRRRVEGTWEPISWREWWLSSERFAAGLLDVGCKLGDRVILLSSTRFSWMIADMGIMMAGGVCVPCFPSSMPEQIDQILADATPTVAYVEDPAQLEKLFACDHFASIQTVILKSTSCVFKTPDPTGRIALELKDVDRRGSHALVITYDELVSRGRKTLTTSASVLSGRRRSITDTSIATIVYTSGTSGEQKGVVITHAALDAEIAAMGELKFIEQGDANLLVLPLAHIFARMLYLSSLCYKNELIVGNGLAHIVRDARETNPRVIAVVPYLLDRFRAMVDQDIDRTWSLRGKMATVVNETVPTTSWSARFKQGVLKRVSRSSLEKMFGEELKWLVCGGAKLHPELVHYFDELGLAILEGYGLTEACGVVTVNTPSKRRAGSVGIPLPGIDVALDDEGQVLIRGTTVAAGYYNGGKIAPMVDADGWLETGDLGEFDEDGFLSIVGRNNEMIVTTGGKNIAPRRLELLIEECDAVDRALVVGDGRPFVTALVSLVPGTDGDTRALVEAHMKSVNETLASYQTVKRFAIAPVPFSIDGGELTATLKLRRTVIEERYSNLLDGLYA